jgi:hypothetical protein
MQRIVRQRYFGFMLDFLTFLKQKLFKDLKKTGNFYITPAVGFKNLRFVLTVCMFCITLRIITDCFSKENNRLFFVMAR